MDFLYQTLDKKRMMMIRAWAKRGLRTLFEVGQVLGVNVLPKHFYSSIPDIRALRLDDHWRKPFDMIGVTGSALCDQIACLELLCPPSLAAQWQSLDVYGAASAENGQGGGYGQLEAEVLYAFVHRHRPRRVVQVGCGVSTSVILRAARMANYTPEIICIEPFPSPFLQAAQADGRISLVARRAELVDRSVMTGLAPGDLLFVDSTHAVKPGGEVNRIILDVLPRLGAGVFVHFHDIYFPYDYQRGILDAELFFSLESTLLHAYLIGNGRCRIQLSLSMLHYAAPQCIEQALPHYDPQHNADGLRAAGGQHFPCATYVLTTEPGLGSR